MTETVIRTLTDNTGERERWDAYVRTCPQATFFHLSGWQRVLREALGHRTDYLYAERDGAIVGVLPLGHVRSRLFGNALTSVPFCVYGGVAADDDEAAGALQARAVDIAEQRGVDHLELRHLDERNPDWPRKELYVTFRKEISADDDANMKAIPRKQRAMVRKGIKAGLISEIDADVERFFLAYSESVRNLGTPVMSKRWFAALKAEFGDACELLVITHEGNLVAGVMSFYFRDEVLPYYGGGGDLARQLKGNDFMYWEVMRRAAARGARVFDYGRSKQGTGSFKFKKNWGFEPQPLHYEFHLVNADALPDVNPLNPKYRLFIAAWQRLPLSLSRVIGPWLARSLG